MTEQIDNLIHSSVDTIESLRDELKSVKYQLKQIDSLNHSIDKAKVDERGNKYFEFNNVYIYPDNMRVAVIMQTETLTKRYNELVNELNNKLNLKLDLK